MGTTIEGARRNTKVTITPGMDQYKAIKLSMMKPDMEER